MLREVGFMAVRNSRPYNSPKRTTKNNTSKSKKNISKTKNKDFDVTTRIRVDEVRLNDSESLDTSFLEGRVEKKVKNNSGKVKEKILKDKNIVDETKEIRKKRIFFGITSLAIFIIIVFLFVFYFDKIVNVFKDDLKDKNITVESSKKQEKVIDDNYLFIGGFYTDKFDFDKFDLDYHYVKVSDNNMDTADVLDDMKSKIYDYNPSIIFIELGINDLDSGMDSKDIIKNIKSIIDKIKENRPYARICIESLYPINISVDDFDNEILSDEINNSKIVSFNKQLKDLTEKNDVIYLDMFSMLEKGGKLDSEYTDNGIYLNDDGYKQILKLVNNEIDKD